MLDDDAADDELAALDDGRDPLTGQDGRLRLSFTRIDTLRNCALRFRYQYVDRLPQRPAPALSFGSSIHAVLEWVHDRKVPDVPPLDEMLDRLREVWDSSGYAEVEKAVQVREYERARDVLGRGCARRSAPRPGSSCRSTTT
jgi:putative RecB family exonuclease